MHGIIMLAAKVLHMFPVGRLWTATLTLARMQDLVVSKCGGEKVWQQIAAQAKCPADYVSNQPYDDAVLYDLVKAGCAVLKMKPDELIEQVGYWFIVYAHQKTVQLLIY